MKRPISAGDVCLVVDGYMGKDSPNIGLTVTVQHREGEHSKFGNIWHCTGKGVQQYANRQFWVITGEAGFAQSWLQRIDPPEIKNHRTAKKGVTA
jgi:hypothetical protein